MMLKKIILFLLLLGMPLQTFAADPTILNGYWSESSLSAKVIKYPYVWHWAGASTFSSFTSLSKMHLLESDGKEFVFLYETIAISYENGQYFTRPSEEKNIFEPYRLVRFILQKDERGRDFFREEDCYDRKLQKRNDAYLLNNTDLKSIWASAECRQDSREWSPDLYAYTRLDCKYIDQYPWFFRIIAPEYLSCQHTKKYKEFRTGEE